MANDTFQHEQQVVERAAKTLKSGLADDKEWEGAYAELLAGYEGLLKQARDQVETKVRTRTQELLETQGKLERLIEIGIALSAERSSAVLMEQILIEAKVLTNADGGTLYIRTKDDHLKFEIIRTDSLDYAFGGSSSNEISFEPLPLFEPETNEPNHHNVATHVALSGQLVNIPDAYDTAEFDFSGTQKFDEGTGYHSKSFLTVPMKTRAGRVIGVLQLINARTPNSEEVIPFPNEIEAYVEALSSQAAVALENQQLLEAQRALLDSFIVLIAGAIDEKSPYTGAHCERVPQLAFMLTEAVCDTDQEPFAGFDLTEEEWYEFRIAGWLHDCGKVTTPEYVVDKATKLETIHNRIHEIRMRFEVLRRDAEIDCLNGIIAGDRPRDELESGRNERWAQIENDFAFIAECNIGSEFMDEDKIERIHGISKTNWTRHLDDRLGLAHDELSRKERTPKPSLPAEEPLLADKAEHLILRRNSDAPFGDNEYGFKLDVPEHEYHYGEIHNLCIQRGTLTSEERYKINHHIIQTIIMLEQLPFPKNLERVPEYAGGHHEKMDGTGYPRGLRKSDMSIPARVMAIADIFEALTASDRPYKKAKSLSESIRIMGFMVKDQHIDPDLFRLFLQSGVHMEYAKLFLHPDQIDDVDITEYLAAVDEVTSATPALNEPA